ncbi:vitamin B12 ABC transporter permease BtuC [Pantoea sp. 1.19]|uniref:vitamin B12 ABC transporter permease BtuC n=1 Tax=Pantoea sp. 1.19 TaxID=1925589 RepID=UPI000948B523|nr:vitamin B12 ABC transporter permease BtuC [Pantoea sp. 1.19]
MLLITPLQTQAARRARRWQFGLWLLLIVLTLLSLSAGERWISPVHWGERDAWLWVGQLRLPRTLAVLLVGAALAVTGAVMQALFDNPLAEPGLLGVSSGAGVGVVAGVLLLPTAGSGSLSLFAIAGALLVTGILLRFARRHLSSARLLLAGVALGMIGSALMTWAVYFSSSLDLRQLLYWMMGGFSGIGWQYAPLMLALLPLLFWLLGRWRVLDRLALGELAAQQLGLPLARWRSLLVLATGAVVGICVALAGSIGFVGLVIPHLLRLCGLSQHRALLPCSALAGAAGLLAADILARLLLSAAELPIGVVTATLGAPLFIWLLVRQHR